MKGLKKCLLYVSLFALFSIGFFTVFSGDSFAAPISNFHAASKSKATNLVVCSTWQTDKIQTILNSSNNSNFRQKLNSANRRLDWSSDDSWIIFFNDLATDRIRIGYVDKGVGKLQFAENTNDIILRVTQIEPTTVWSPETEAFTFDLLASSAFQDKYTLYGRSLDITGTGDSCIMEMHGIEIDASYTTWPAPTQINADDIEVSKPKTDCAPLNVICWLGSVVDNMANSFKGLAEALLSGIAALFTPDTDTFAFQFDELMDFFGDKLGFLFYPIQFVLDNLEAVISGINSDASWGTGICGIPQLDLGLSETASWKFFGTNLPFERIACNDFGARLRVATRVLFPIMISFSLLSVFRHKMHEIKTKA